MADPERWRQVRRITEEALDLDREARGPFLDEACGPDQVLRSQVESLLGAAAGSQGFLDPPDPGSLHRALGGFLADALVGARVGSYQLVRVIASGGMGTVYEAVQDHPRRTVALKMLRFGLNSPAALRRFRDEAEILARLRSPGIAQVYEADTFREGAGPGGREIPYFAMEYIEGARHLLDYVQEHPLGLRERLDLFTKVCEAVHQGHQKGVIHRDLKPQNILVDPTGQPKIIDFGVARATGLDLATATRETRAGEIVGTLQYMSPEQLEADGGEPDIRIDVYALGVILYELLCDRGPFDIGGRGFPETIVILRTADPPRPSAVRSSIPRDLDWVAAKAMEREPSRRYGSASELAADIRRFLRHEPILACPPSRWYRFRKLLVRHRAVAAGIATLAAGLITALSIFVWKDLEYREARDQTRTLRAHFRRELAYGPQDLGGRQSLYVDVLDHIASRIGAGPQGQGLVQAHLHEWVGLAYQALGMYDDAETNLRKAVGLRALELPEPDPDRLYALKVLGILLQYQGKYAESERVLREAVELHRRVHGPAHEDTLELRNSLGLTLSRAGRPAEAEETLRAALELRRENLGATHVHTASSLNSLGFHLLRQRRLPEAVPFLCQGLRIRLERFEAGTEDPNVLVSMRNVGDLVGELGDRAGAVEILRQTVAALGRRLGREHPDTLLAMIKLGRQMRERPDLVRAGAVLWEARALLGRAVRRDHPYALEARHQWAVWLAADCRDAEAEAELEAVHEARRRVLGERHPETLETRWELGRLHRQTGRWERAEEILSEVAGAAEAWLAPDDGCRGLFLLEQGRCLLDLGRTAEARRRLEAGLENLRITAGEDHGLTRGARELLERAGG